MQRVLRGSFGALLQQQNTREQHVVVDVDRELVHAFSLNESNQAALHSWRSGSRATMPCRDEILTLLLQCSPHRRDHVESVGNADATTDNSPRVFRTRATLRPVGWDCVYAAASSAFPRWHPSRLMSQPAPMVTFECGINGMGHFALADSRAACVTDCALPNSLDSEPTLVDHALLVMGGIPSATFRLDARKCAMFPPSCGTLYGRTSLMLEFALTGTRYLRVAAFAEYFGGAAAPGGAVLQAYAAALLRYLRSHEVVLLRVAEQFCSRKSERSIQRSLLQLHQCSRRLQLTLKEVARFCECENDMKFDDGACAAAAFKTFPSGSALLSRLYLRVCACTTGVSGSTPGSAFQRLLVFLFCEATRPYLQLLGTWLFGGDVREDEVRRARSNSCLHRPARAHNF